MIQTNRSKFDERLFSDIYLCRLERERDRDRDRDRDRQRQTETERVKDRNRDRERWGWGGGGTFSLLFPLLIQFNMNNAFIDHGGGGGERGRRDNASLL